jgi:hypothetical protein
MMMPRNYVGEILRDPYRASELTLAEWDLLIRQARSADLLGRIAEQLNDVGLLATVPPAPRLHLDSARVLFAAQSRAVRREVMSIVEALSSLRNDVIFLKGTAYLLAGLPAAAGRLFSDVDIIVPRDQLPAVESQLMLHGWVSTHRHPYDQRYYRDWMHELPPMQHIERQTVIDVHHAIVPATARLKSDAAAIIDHAVPVEGLRGVRVLAPADMVLHSATHLFFNEEFSHGMRDLSDMDLLLRHFGRDARFWEMLLGRARQLNLTRPLYYCLRHAVRVFATPVPTDVLQSTLSAAPAGWLMRLMDRLWEVALRPPHPSLAGPYDTVAGSLLYYRAHWERMPAYLLVYHVLHKVLRREPGEKGESPTV